MAGVLFEVTTGGIWFDGYWWWVCPSGQSTSPQKFALWSLYNVGTATLIPAATITSGTLIAGQWNYIPLDNPIPLSIGACYNACTGFGGSFPVTQNQFGSGRTIWHRDRQRAADRVLRPVRDTTSPFLHASGSIQRRRVGPRGDHAGNGNQSDNLWMDLQVGTTPATGASYRLWPNYPTLPGAASGGSPGYTLATEFQLAQPCTLDNIWFYSASGATALPTVRHLGCKHTERGFRHRQHLTDMVRGCGRRLGRMRVQRRDPARRGLQGSGLLWWHLRLVPVYNRLLGRRGPGAKGITTGPLTAPSTSAATSPGQCTYNAASWAYPDTYGNAGNGENYWVDVEVTPS